MSTYHLSILICCALLLPQAVAESFFSAEADRTEVAAASAQLALVPVAAPATARVSPAAATSVTIPLPMTLTSTTSAEVSVETVGTNGSTAFCEALSLSLNGQGLLPVADFATGALPPNAGYVLTLAYDESKRNFSHGADCEIILSVRAWPAGQSYETAGFTDTHEITLRAEASLVVLNEVLAQPGAGFPEFIELFNLSEQPVDVAGWTITELAGENVVSHTITSAPSAAADLVAYDGSFTTIVPALGHLALRFNGASAYLNNTGDTITLFDGTGTQLDQYVYTTSISGKSDARIPDGTGAWIDPVPTPGEPNQLDEGEPLPQPLMEAPATEPLPNVPIDTNTATPTAPEVPHVPTPAPEETDSVVEEVLPPVEEELVESEEPALEAVDDQPAVTVDDVPTEPLPLSGDVEEPEEPPAAKTEEEEPVEAAEVVTETGV